MSAILYMVNLFAMSGMQYIVFTLQFKVLSCNYFITAYLLVTNYYCLLLLLITNYLLLIGTSITTISMAMLNKIVCIVKASDLHFML